MPRSLSSDSAETTNGSGSSQPARAAGSAQYLSQTWCAVANSAISADLTLRPTVRPFGMSGARGSTAKADPAAATGYGFGHFARGFIDHFAFEADRATSFAF